MRETKFPNWPLFALSFLVAAGIPPNVAQTRNLLIEGRTKTVLGDVPSIQYPETHSGSTSLIDRRSPCNDDCARSTAPMEKTRGVLVAENSGPDLQSAVQATAEFNRAQSKLAKVLGLKKRAATLRAEAKRLEEAGAAIRGEKLLQNSEMSRLIQRAFIHKIEKKNKTDPAKKTSVTSEDIVDDRLYETAKSLDSMLTSVFSGLSLQSANTTKPTSESSLSKSKNSPSVMTDALVRLGKAQAEVARLWALKAEGDLMLTEANAINAGGIHENGQVYVNFLKWSVDTQSAISRKIVASFALASREAKASSAKTGIGRSRKSLDDDTSIPPAEANLTTNSAGDVSSLSSNGKAVAKTSGTVKSRNELEGDLLFSALQTVTSLTGGGSVGASPASPAQTWYTGLSAVVRASGLLGRAQADLADALGLKQEAALMRAQAVKIEESGDSLGGSQLEEFGQNSVKTQKAINDRLEKIVTLDTEQKDTVGNAGGKVMLASGNAAIGVTTLVSASQAFAAAPLQGVTGVILDPEALKVVPKIPELLPEAISVIPKIFEVANEFRRLAVEKEIAIAELPEAPDFDDKEYQKTADR